MQYTAHWYILLYICDITTILIKGIHFECVLLLSVCTRITHTDTQKRIHENELQLIVNCSFLFFLSGLWANVMWGTETGKETILQYCPLVASQGQAGICPNMTAFNLCSVGRHETVKTITIYTAHICKTDPCHWEFWYFWMLLFYPMQKSQTPCQCLPTSCNSVFSVVQYFCIPTHLAFPRPDIKTYSQLHHYTIHFPTCFSFYSVLHRYSRPLTPLTHTSMLGVAFIQTYSRAQCCRGLRGVTSAGNVCSCLQLRGCGSPPLLYWDVQQHSGLAAQTHCQV